MRIQKARLAFTSSRHLLRRLGISLSIMGRVCTAVIRSVLQYDSETRPLSKEYLRWPWMFEHRYLRNTGRIWRANFVNNSKARPESRCPRIQLVQ